MHRTVAPVDGFGGGRGGAPLPLESSWGDPQLSVSEGLIQEVLDLLLKKASELVVVRENS